MANNTPRRGSRKRGRAKPIPDLGCLRKSQSVDGKRKKLKSQCRKRRPHGNALSEREIRAEAAKRVRVLNEHISKEASKVSLLYYVLIKFHMHHSFVITHVLFCLQLKVRKDKFKFKKVGERSQKLAGELAARNKVLSESSRIAAKAQSTAGKKVSRIEEKCRKSGMWCVCFVLVFVYHHVHAN